MIARIAVFAAATLAAGSALAQDYSMGSGTGLSQNSNARTGLYLYGSAGLSMATTDEGLAQTQADAAVGPGAAVRFDTDRYAGKFLVGYRFNKYFGIEGGYVDVAKVSIQATGPGGTFNSTSKLKGGQLAGIAWLPATENLALFVKLGAAVVSSKYESPGSADVKSTDIQTFFGLGLQYDFSKDFFGRAEYERYSKFGNSATGDVSASIYSLGVGYKF